MDYNETLKFISKDYEEEVIKALSSFIKLENISPSYDTTFFSNGKTEQAAEFILSWIQNVKIKNLKAEIIKEKNIAPLIFIQIPSTSNSIKKNILLYCHYDKQPGYDNWNEGLHPFIPIIKDNYLYGRGAADDGYAIFSYISAIKAIENLNGNHGKISIIIEGAEESGSPGLMTLINKIEDKIGIPDLTICFDSYCTNYNTLYITSSLRGNILVNINVECLNESVHSGSGSGIAPDSFNIIRILLDRLEDKNNSKVIEQLQVEIPENFIQDIKKIVEFAKDESIKYNAKLLPGVKAISNDYFESIINNTWKSTIVVTGMSGFPEAEKAGNVLRKSTSCRLSIRTPPTLSKEKAKEIIEKILTENIPYNAKVKIDFPALVDGWFMKKLDNKINESFMKSSKFLFGCECYNLGSGITIPFINMLNEKYKDCNMFVSGVLGPKSNAHSPNECLNIDYSKKLTVALAHLISDFCS